jgi:lambda repressor-like predicted transcriptional regulator
MSTTITELVKANVQQYIAFQNAFDQCDPRIKDIIVRMLRIYNDEESSEQEKRLAFNTVAEALFPGYAEDAVAAERKCAQTDKAIRRNEELDAEEQVFADRVRGLLKDRSMTQEDLAVAVGISQPAVANLLNRNCRPQKRTVARIAEALQVEPELLWPTLAK